MDVMNRELLSGVSVLKLNFCQHDTVLKTQYHCNLSNTENIQSEGL